ncbi:heavy metal-binding protein HIP-like [Mytilus californianus]|uniref:heavy metal-binding protein HIP-like n=1 Tax=Mytilus californianus TaxID=6549 RepID=UPI002246D2B5|nr:heavy metal-binding protein HIP-like [Mytilus californianus]
MFAFLTCFAVIISLVWTDQCSLENTLCSLCGKRQVSDEHPDLTALRKAIKINRKDIDVQKKEIQDLKERHSHVAFFAYMSTSWKQLSKHKRLVYDVVDLNNGDGYNKANGEFTAPSNGLYVFHVSTGAYDNSHASVELVLQGRIRNIAWADSMSHNDRTFVTTVTPLQLNKGDVVYTRIGNGYGGKFIESTSYIRTSFSGVKIN